MTRICAFRVLDNLAVYAGRVFDYFVANPVTSRILQWRDVERAHATTLETETYRRKLDEVAAAQKAYAIDDGFAPVDVIAIIEATIESGLGATVGLRAAHDGSTEPRLAESRRAVVETVRRIT